MYSWSAFKLLSFIIVLFRAASPLYKTKEETPGTLIYFLFRKCTEVSLLFKSIYICLHAYTYILNKDMYVPCTFPLSIAWICLLIPSIVCLCFISCLFGLETHTPGFSTYLSIYPYIYLSIYSSMYESKAKQRPAWNRVVYISSFISNFWKFTKTKNWNKKIREKFKLTKFWLKNDFCFY